MKVLMQNIEVFIGSPRKRGNTYSLAEMFEKGLDKKTSTFGSSFLYDYDIQPCNDCRACKKGKMECVLDDDMKKLYDRLEIADVIIIGTPIYWSGPSAKTKLMLDRLRPYYSNNKLSGKKIALFLPAGDGESDCDLTIEMFRRSFKALGVELIASVTAKAYDIGEANNDKLAIASITNLLTSINN